MPNNIYGLNKTITKNLVTSTDSGKIKIEYDTAANAVYGLGERFCSVNHIGKNLKNEVFEKFCEQGEHTYLPIPFYHADDGHGVFIDTSEAVLFDFQKGHFSITLEENADYTIYFLYGTAKEIIAEFIKRTGEIALAPKWAFGVWASANRWKCQQDIEQQMELIEKYQYPVNVVVIEAWSDEATFYAWNGSDYQVTKGDKGLSEALIRYNAPWENPKKMIEDIHQKNMKLILWQIPALKLLDEGQICPQHLVDCDYAIEKKLVGENMDGTPYKIPKQWFIGSMIPDFANPATRDWWFLKRKYLLDMGVDGFKTDGGEFVHDLNTKFYEDVPGKEEKNLYPAQYEKAYSDFVGEGRVLFSRAGYLGAQSTPMHWAGDQMSKFTELKAVLNAGLSLSLSGVPFWSFDIGGFAGPMPSKELYLRATAFAAFVPAMQWHSEPADGQFAELLKGNGMINDRSPWNMADVCQDESIITMSTYFANLHMNFLPYFYEEAKKCVQMRSSFMKHLYLEYPEDKNVTRIEDEYMIGDLLIAPVIESGANGRKIYLPKGRWYDIMTKKEVLGEQEIFLEVSLDTIPVFVRDNSAVLLNITSEGLGSFVGNDIEDKHLKLLLTGDAIDYHYKKEDGTEFIMSKGKLMKNTMQLETITLPELVTKKRR